MCEHDPWIWYVSLHRKNSLLCLAGHTNMNSLWQGSNESVFVWSYLQWCHCGAICKPVMTHLSSSLNVSKSMALRRINNANDGLLNSNLGCQRWRMTLGLLRWCAAWSLNKVCFTTQKEQLTMPSWTYKYEQLVTGLKWVSICSKLSAATPLWGAYANQ